MRFYVKNGTGYLCWSEAACHGYWTSREEATPFEFASVAAVVAISVEAPQVVCVNSLDEEIILQFDNPVFQKAVQFSHLNVDTPEP